MQSGGTIKYVATKICVATGHSSKLAMLRELPEVTNSDLWLNRVKKQFWEVLAQNGRVCYLPEPSQSPLIPCITTLNHPRHRGEALGSEIGA